MSRRNDALGAGVETIQASPSRPSSPNNRLVMLESSQSLETTSDKQITSRVVCRLGLNRDHNCRQPLGALLEVMIVVEAQIVDHRYGLAGPSGWLSRLGNNLARLRVELEI